MKRVEIFNFITMALTFLALVPKMESLILPIPSTPPRPLCASQFALVNYACSRLPFTHVTQPPPSSSPTTPPSPDNDEGHKNHHGHGHNHRHGHKHRHHHETPDEENCCRWAKEVDNECVCELLIRLPPFLIRPLHQYTLSIGEECEITYSCGAPI